MVNSKLTFLVFASSAFAAVVPREDPEAGRDPTTEQGRPPASWGQPGSPPINSDNNIPGKSIGDYSHWNPGFASHPELPISSHLKAAATGAPGAGPFPETQPGHGQTSVPGTSIISTGTDSQKYPPWFQETPAPQIGDSFQMDHMSDHEHPTPASSRYRPPPRASDNFIRPFSTFTPISQPHPSENPSPWDHPDVQADGTPPFDHQWPPSHTYDRPPVSPHSTSTIPVAPGADTHPKDPSGKPEGQLPTYTHAGNPTSLQGGSTELPSPPVLDGEPPHLPPYTPPSRPSEVPSQTPQPEEQSPRPGGQWPHSYGVFPLPSQSGTEQFPHPSGPNQQTSHLPPYTPPSRPLEEPSQTPQPEEQSPRPGGQWPHSYGVFPLPSQSGTGQFPRPSSPDQQPPHIIPDDSEVFPGPIQPQEQQPHPEGPPSPTGSGSPPLQNDRGEGPHPAPSGTYGGHPNSATGSSPGVPSYPQQSQGSQPTSASFSGDGYQGGSPAFSCPCSLGHGRAPFDKESSGHNPIPMEYTGGFSSFPSDLPEKDSSRPNDEPYGGYYGYSVPPQAMQEGGHPCPKHHPKPWPNSHPVLPILGQASGKSEPAAGFTSSGKPRTGSPEQTRSTSAAVPSHSPAPPHLPVPSPHPISKQPPPRATQKYTEAPSPYHHLSAQVSSDAVMRETVSNSLASVAVGLLLIPFVL